VSFPDAGCDSYTVIVEVGLRRKRLACPLCEFTTRARYDTRAVSSTWRHTSSDFVGVFTDTLSGGTMPNMHETALKRPLLTCPRTMAASVGTARVRLLCVVVNSLDPGADSAVIANSLSIRRATTEFAATTE